MVFGDPEQESGGLDVELVHPATFLTRPAMGRQMNHGVDGPRSSQPEHQLSEPSGASQVDLLVRDALNVRQPRLAGFDAHGQHVVDPRVGDQTRHQAPAQRGRGAGHQHGGHTNTP